MSEEIHINPVTAWNIQTVESMQLLLIQLSFISQPFQRPDEAQQGLVHAITLQQAEELIEVLKRGVDKLKTAEGTPVLGPRH